MNAFRLRRLLLCLGLAASATSQAGTTIVLYGDSDYPPYSYMQNGRFTGIYVDMLNLAARKLAPHYKLELRPVPWKRGLAEMETGHAFGLFPPGLKKERGYISAYSVPLYRETVVLFCTEKVMKTPRAMFPADFTGLTVGVNSGFLLSARLMDAANQNLLRLAPATGNDANLKKLALERIDCYASDRGAAMYSAKLLQGGVKLREAVELSGENTYIGYSVNNNPPYKADFIEKMNAAIESLHKSGASARIEQSYLR
ncbi:MAG: transporter substrate-binding domain-containing protein [Pseudomonadota bacterium]